MKLFFDYQSGFKSKHSLKTCLVHLSNQALKNFETRKSTGMILIGLQKAFDTLDHECFFFLKKKKNLTVTLDKSVPDQVLSCF